MQPNPLLHNLGFADNDRVVIIHVDDVGMCQASVAAYEDLLDFGLITSAALMTPCPWALHAVSAVHRHPTADIGVHLTITSEWQTYRWGPLSTRDSATGLLDEQGYFFRDVASVQSKADPAAVQAELACQVEHMLAAGIEPTHADTHMGAIAHLKFIPAYLQLAYSYGLPPMLFRMDQAAWQATGLDTDTAQMAAQLVQQLESDGLPLLDHIRMMTLEKSENRLEQVKETIEALPAGITHLIIHPAKDTSELRAITPDWRCRVADYETFTGEPLRAYLQESGVQLIGYRPIKEIMKRV